MIKSRNMGTFIDLTGKKFERLTVIKRLKNKGRTLMWECLCICGKIKNNNASNLNSGRTKSCGCFHREAVSVKMRTHGMTKTPFYRTWGDMLTRTTNSKYKGYYLYGGRGIKVCKKWMKFENFKDDMYESYLESVKKSGKENTTIERRSVNGNYCKENCRWATKQEQANNKRNSVFIVLNGIKKTINEWSRCLDIPRNTIGNRSRRGLPVSLILKKDKLLDSKYWVWKKRKCKTVA